LLDVSTADRQSWPHKSPWAWERKNMKGKDSASKVAGALLVAGLVGPGAAEAANIPLGDPSFDNFVVPTVPGYAYAAPLGAAPAYRPTSAWVDDLDSPPGYTQDNSDSNWLYTAAYAEDSGTHLRGSPRTGNQAMHGLFNYSAQETGAVFEAQMTYTFSVWAQGDIDATPESSRVFLYLFDGSVPFTEAGSLKFQRFGVDTGNFINRPVGSTPAQSKASWTHISMSYTVLPGAPEIGHTIGVGFWVADDGALDDATLTSAAVPDPASAALFAVGGLALFTGRRRRRRPKLHGP
jgi:MYXO-CTERM domain-containing protein